MQTLPTCPGDRNSPGPRTATAPLPHAAALPSPPPPPPPRPAARAPRPAGWWRRAWAGLRSAWVVLALAALYVTLSTGPAVFEQIEGQYAGAAREMLDRPGDYQPATRGQLWRGHALVPTNDGVPRLQKPPLVYWLVMGSLRVFGTSEFAARLPNALAATLWFAGVYALGCRLVGPRLGRTAALILGTMMGTFVFSHLLMPEPFLAASLTWTFWCFAGALREPERAGRWMLGAWGCMALGCLAKGLHGAGYPLAVAAVAAWRWPESRPVWRALWRPAGVALFLGMLLPWYVAMEQRFPGFLRDQLWNEQLGHVFNRRWPPDSRRVSLGIFALEHLVFFLPWTLFLPTAWLHARRTRPGPAASGRERAAQALPWIWFVGTAISVIPSSLQDYYTLSAWGAAALWLARPWAENTPGSAAAPVLPRWSLAGPGWTLAGLGVLAMAGGWWFGIHRAIPDGGMAAHRVTSGDRDNIVHTVADFPAERWRELLPLLGLTAGSLLIGGVAAGTLAARGRRGAVVPTVAAAMAVVLVAAGRGMGIMEDEISLKRIALAINARATPAALIVCQGLPADSPSLFFYLDRQVLWVDSEPAQEFAPRALGIGRELFLGRGDFIWRWFDPAGPPVFLICDDADLPAWRETLALSPEQTRPIARSGTRVALLNRPAAPVALAPR